jgi:hypothetical protein
MFTRRKFIQTFTAGAVTAIAVNPLYALGTEGTRKLKNIGFIEGIIDKELK